MRYNETGAGRNQPAGQMKQGPGSKFFRMVFADLAKRKFAPTTPLLLLVGGTDWRSLALRAAQASLRLDRQPSFWSHAAVIVDWASKDPAQARGVEVAFAPEAPGEQVPERNGATMFRLGRYCDEKAFPHLAVITFSQKPGTQSPVKVDLTLARGAALSPNRDRVRFPTWEQLGIWAHYLHAPDSAPNPLTTGTALPAASYCEYVFEAGGIDLTPNATGPQACPELFWATSLFWHEGFASEQIEVVLYHREGDRHAFTREALDPMLTL